MSKFLINKSQGKVSIIDGRAFVAVGGFLEVTDEEALLFN